MTTREAILSEISEISEMISAARDRLAQNEIIMIKDINGRVQGMVESITELPPEQAIELRRVIDDQYRVSGAAGEKPRVRLAASG